MLEKNNHFCVYLFFREFSYSFFWNKDVSVCNYCTFFIPATKWLPAQLIPACHNANLIWEMWHQRVLNLSLALFLIIWLLYKTAPVSQPVLQVTSEDRLKYYLKGFWQNRFFSESKLWCCPSLSVSGTTPSVNACDWRTVATRRRCLHAFQPRGAAVELQENKSASLNISCYCVSWCHMQIKISVATSCLTSSLTVPRSLAMTWEEL